MKVLIIGGAGYVGSPLAYRLERDGHDVTVLDSLMFGGESLLGLRTAPRFSLLPGDLRHRETLEAATEGQDAVVLLGAIVGEPACNRDPETAVSTNLDGARLVVDASRRAGIERFVFVSTCSNYGIAESDAPARETSPLNPISVYAETKVGAEQASLEAASEGFHPTVLRLATAFGLSPRMRFDLLVSDFTLAAVRDRKIVIYGEQFWRPFVHVIDIAEAIALTLEAPVDAVSGEVFNVGSNENNLRKIDLGERVADIVAGTELEFVERFEDPRSYRVDFAKITDRLGYRSAWSVDRGIHELSEALAAGVFPDPDSPIHKN